MPSVGAMNVWTAPWSTVMQLETKYLRLRTAVTLGSRFGRLHRPPGARPACAAHVHVNDAGASTLVRPELARKADLLNGKKLVIWEFIERDICFGAEGWRDVPLPGPAARP